MTEPKNLEKLKSITKREELADLLGLSRRRLFCTLYMEPMSSKYNTFSIPKKSGSDLRIIKAPNSHLKFIQWRLAKYLSECLEEIKKKEKFPHLSFAFQKKLSIKDNALKHINKRWVLNLDISDFFSSISFNRVNRFFLKNKFFQLNDEIATTIAQIACDEQALPQGSPCSPIISEFITQSLDVRLLKLAKQYHLTYSRYADDITLSTNQKVFPREVAYPDSSAENGWQVSETLRSIIQRSGFKINEEKTRMQKNCVRQVATGLVINKKPNVADNYYRTVRSMCHHVFEKGAYYRSPEDKDNPTCDLNPLAGKLNFIHDIKKNSDETNSSSLRGGNNLTLSGFDGLYKKFLFYRLFLCLNKPMIVTEGKTDPIYLRCAIKHGNKIKNAYGKTVGRYITQSILFFSRERSYAEAFNFKEGGSNNLLDIIKLYKEYLHSSKKRQIQSRPCAFPVILLFDNDDGIKTTSSYVKKNFDIILTTETTDDFYYLFDNLYIVKTVEKKYNTEYEKNDDKNHQYDNIKNKVKNKKNLIKNSESCIEDCFFKKTLEKTLHGKKFTKNNNGHSNTEYSKDKFATEIVSAEPWSIDFSGFDGLLDRIRKVIEDYKKLHNHPTINR
ncbi:retron Ec67 family RNA-directed DNA polymerase/endonuclease [Bartonella apis]|uniref:retron Ec67 family RNA-directed DNA polymerase/endonuclease n=1 Tax=Bartonella apis TaxID=1686310 RepID=UPI000962EB84|nr:retron Ec67 family RNA-directed DNA polymerase/endonuclease [Bartonella apis]OLY48080.1 Reverse transcriptase (RNA-dependent DNA polymerase) [Bartonella apis]